MIIRNVFKQAKLNLQLYSNHISLLTAIVWLHTCVSTASLLVYYVGFPLVLEFIVSTEISHGMLYPVCVVMDTGPRQTFCFASVKASIPVISLRCRSNRHVSFYLLSPSVFAKLVHEQVCLCPLGITDRSVIWV